MKFEDARVGDSVLIIGRIVGLKERRDGSNAVNVEYDRRGQPVEKWFDAADLNVGKVTGGDGI